MPLSATRLVLRFSRQQYRSIFGCDGEFVLPLGFNIPLLACMVLGFLLLQLTSTEALSLGGPLFIATVLYGLGVWLLRR